MSGRHPGRAASVILICGGVGTIFNSFSVVKGNRYIFHPICGNSTNFALTTTSYLNFPLRSA